MHDDQVPGSMQDDATAVPSVMAAHVLVCIGDDTRASGIVHEGVRLAGRLGARWTALVVEGRRNAGLSEVRRDAVSEALRLAQRLGAETKSLPGSGDVAEDILGFARDIEATHIVVGRPRSPRWREALLGSVVHRLLRGAGAMSVHVIAGGEPFEGVTPRRLATVAPRASRSAGPYVAAAACVGAALVVAFLAEPFLGVEYVDLVLLCAVLVMAILYGLAPSLLAVALASAAYNFFFIPPRFTFSISDPRHAAALFFFALVAVLVSNLAAHARQEAIAARRRARETEALYGFSRKLAGCGTLDDVLWATAFQVASMLKVRVVILLPGPVGLAVHAGYPPEDEIASGDLGAALWAFENARPAGRGAEALPGAGQLFLPLVTGRGPLGVVGIADDGRGPMLTPEQQRLLDSLVDQGALAIERVRLVEDLEHARLDAATDRLRQALLTSISHDLKTPLASVLGSAQVMRDLGDRLPEATRVELLATVIEEAERLNRFIANLLDMTRLESGAVSPNLQAHDLGDLVGGTLRRATKVLSGHRVVAELAEDLPLVQADAVLFEPVLFNVLDNAGKYADPGTTILVRAQRDGEGVRLDVLDEGPGIPPGAEEAIFEKFHRVRKGDHVRPGTGLGLPIARGLVEALGGRITAANRPDRPGAAFTIHLAGAASAIREPEGLA